MIRSILLMVATTLLTASSCVVPAADWAPPSRNDPLVVRQRRNDDCGIAALATVFGLIGKSRDYQTVARETHIGRRGVSMQTIAQIASDHGVIATGYRFGQLDLANTAARGKPWIALLGSGVSGHYVVVRSLVGDTVFALDPAQGSRLIKRRSFERLWTGHALLFE